MSRFGIAAEDVLFFQAIDDGPDSVDVLFAVVSDVVQADASGLFFGLLEEMDASENQFFGMREVNGYGQDRGQSRDYSTGEYTIEISVNVNA
jgi:hypothetical protein